MDTVVFDGRKYAGEKEQILKERVQGLREKGVVPKLVWISVGYAEQNLLYGRVKRRAAERLGIEFEKYQIHSTSSGQVSNIKYQKYKEGNYESPELQMSSGQVGIRNQDSKAKSEKRKAKSYNLKVKADEKSVVRIQNSEWLVRQVIKKIKEANEDPQVHGVMVQLPVQLSVVSYQLSVKKTKNDDRRLMADIEDRNFEDRKYLVRILGAIVPKKDVDCLTPENLGRAMMGFAKQNLSPRFLPATVKAVADILAQALDLDSVNPSQPPLVKGRGISPPGKGGDRRGLMNFDKVKGKRIVVVGAGLEVGKPLVAYLSNLGATVLWAKSGERNLSEIIRMGEVVISATGKPGLITGEMVKDDVIAIDVGSPRGDFEFDSVSKRAAFITPVPGGVGPVTVSCLYENLLMAAESVR